MKAPVLYVAVAILGSCGLSRAFSGDSPTGTAPATASETALLIVDVQDCFLDKETTSGEPGTLSVANAHKIIPHINSLKPKASEMFGAGVFKSQDYHPAGHVSFFSSHLVEDENGTKVPPAPFSIQTLMCTLAEVGVESEGCCGADDLWQETADGAWAPTSDDEPAAANNPACRICGMNSTKCRGMTQTMWPEHCLQDGDSTFPPSIESFDGEVIVQKGDNKFVDAYSAFTDNLDIYYTPLLGKLQEAGVKKIVAVGIATDYCVLYSVVDAIGFGFEVVVLSDAIAGIFDDGVAFSIADMKAKGATFMTTAEFLSTVDSSETKDYSDELYTTTAPVSPGPGADSSASTSATSSVVSIAMAVAVLIPLCSPLFLTGDE